MPRKWIPVGAMSLLLCSAPAGAQLPHEWSLCGVMSGFQGVCGQVRLSTLDAATNRYSLVLANVGETGLLTALAVYSRSIEFTSWLVNPIPSGWEQGDEGLSGLGFNDPPQRGFDVSANTQNGVHYGIKSATDTRNYGDGIQETLYTGSLEFVFQTDRPIHELADLAVRWHAQAIDGVLDASYKCDSSILHADDYPCTTSVVPEPFTTTLLGTGLLTVGILRRRRKRFDGVDE